MQLKTVQDPGAIFEHFARYPDIEVLASSEVYRALRGTFVGQVSDSGVSNEAISALSRETLENLIGDDIGDLIQNAMMTSVLVAGAIQARAALARRRIDARELCSTLELAGIGAATAITVHALLNLV